MTVDKNKYILSINGMSKSFGRNKVLKHINLNVKPGTIMGLMGENGAGKSTFIKLLSHEVMPDSGTVIVNEIDVTKLKKRKIPYLRRRLGTVFQDFRLLPNKTVFENIAFALEVIEEKPKIIREKVSRVLELVGLPHKANDLPQDLSGGEQQRVAVARAMVNNPMLILADEPTGNLDSKTSDEVMALLKTSAMKYEQTLIVITHNEDIAQMGNRKLVITDGKVVEQ